MKRSALLLIAVLFAGCVAPSPRDALTDGPPTSTGHDPSPPSSFSTEHLNACGSDEHLRTSASELDFSITSDMYAMAITVERAAPGEHEYIESTLEGSNGPIMRDAADLEDGTKRGFLFGIGGDRVLPPVGDYRFQVNLSKGASHNVSIDVLLKRTFMTAQAGEGKWMLVSYDDGRRLGVVAQRGNRSIGTIEVPMADPSFTTVEGSMPAPQNATDIQFLGYDTTAFLNLARQSLILCNERSQKAASFTTNVTTGPLPSVPTLVVAYRGVGTNVYLAEIGWNETTPCFPRCPTPVEATVTFLQPPMPPRGAFVSHEGPGNASFFIETWNVEADGLSLAIHRGLDADSVDVLRDDAHSVEGTRGIAVLLLCLDRPPSQQVDAWLAGCVPIPKDH
jgi:hypothetical protein